jgi:lactate racemase
MAVTVDFQDGSLDFEIPSERVVASWSGPKAIGPAGTTAAVRDALERPRDFPPLRQMFVPGDRVAIAFDPTIPQARSVLDALIDVLEGAGVESERLTIVAPAHPAALGEASSPARRIVVHDPDERGGMAYLASTREGRRVYLNRLLTDADVVVPVGRLGYDSELGFRGPWSVLFPGLSDRQAILALRDRTRAEPGGGEGRSSRGRLDQSFEVSWLLGTQFYLGIVPAATGLFEVVAGRDTAVRERGIESVERIWTLHAPSRAELVVAGVGGPDSVATLEDVAAALETATRLVQHGGKIVVLSQASGSIGPSLQKLTSVDDPKDGPGALRGHENDDDYPIARRIAHATAWADVFLASALDPESVEGLAIVPLERPEQARRLAANSGSVTFVSRAELTRGEASDES